MVELTEEGETPVTYRKGDSFIMKPGYRGVWKTIETVRKIYVIVEGKRRRRQHPGNRESFAHFWK